jgi:hypothetical protein
MLPQWCQLFLKFTSSDMTPAINVGSVEHPSCGLCTRLVYDCVKLVPLQQTLTDESCILQQQLQELLCFQSLWVIFLACQLLTAHGFCEV